MAASFTEHHAMNYFEVFELEPTLGLDTAQLEKKFHSLSRQHHPDYHTDRSAEEREQSLRMTALLNDAYRTLRDRTRRAEYLVRSEGFEVDGSKVPKTLLMEVFEINEELEQLRSARQSGAETESLVKDLERFRAQIATKRDDYEAELGLLSSAWDDLRAKGANDEERSRLLGKIADSVSQFAYIRNLEHEIDGEVSH